MCAARQSKTTTGSTSHQQQIYHSGDNSIEESSQFLTLLGKRSQSDTSVEKLQEDTESHDEDGTGGSGDDGDKRERR
jgi:hypothetical protein